MTPGLHKALVRRSIESVWNQGAPALIDELIVPDYLQHAQGVPPGRAGVKQFFAALRVAFPDIQNTIEDMLAEDDTVVWRSTIRGTHTGPFRGILPTDKQRTSQPAPGERSVCRNWGEQDNLGLLQQLGVVP